MRAGAEQAGSSPDNGATHLSKLPYRGARNPVCAGDELDLTGVQLPLDRSRHLAQTLKHRSGAVDLAPGHRVNQEKLLFDAYRKRLSRAKPAFTVPLCGHGREVCPALSDSAGAGSAAISAPPAAQTTTVRAGWHAWSLRRWLTRQSSCRLRIQRPVAAMRGIMDASPNTLPRGPRARPHVLLKLSAEHLLLSRRPRGTNVESAGNQIVAAKLAGRGVAGRARDRIFIGTDGSFSRVRADARWRRSGSRSARRAQTRAVRRAARG